MPTSRPVIIYGSGIHLAHAEDEARDFAHKSGIPVAPTWGALDLFPSDDLLVIGSFGTHGTRAGNFAVQNATHILAVGTRLDSKATGTPIQSFAREARIVMVDIDQAEIDKFGDRVKGLCMDAKRYLGEAIALSPSQAYTEPSTEWLAQIKQWKEKYPVVLPEYRLEEGVNPYVFLETLSDLAQENEIICSDTGCAVAWISQGWKWKKGQRFIHAFNQTPMGYGLPAAIGAWYARMARGMQGSQRVVLITGDGSLMMSLGELATIKGLPIKIFMFNNLGHAMCRQTQREWLGGTYPATSLEGGLKFPKFRNVAWGFGIPTWCLEHQHQRRKDEDSMQTVIQKALDADGPMFVEVMVSPDAEVVPKTKFGYPNEDSHPLLPRDELAQQMIVKPYVAS